MNHSRRKKIRKALAVVYGAVIALALFGIYYSLELSAGFLNANSVKNAVTSENYLHRTEDSFTEDVAEILGGYNLPDYVIDKITENANIYNRVFRDLNHKYDNQTIEQNFASFLSDAEYFLSPYVRCGLLTEEEHDSVMEQLTVLSNDTVSLELPYKTDSLLKTLGTVAKPVGFLAAVILFLAFGSMYYMYEYKHRAFRVLFYGAAASAVGNLAATLFLYLRYKDCAFSAKTAVQTAVMSAYVKNSVSVFAIGSAITVLIAVMAYFLYRYSRTRS